MKLFKRFFCVMMSLMMVMPFVSSFVSADEDVKAYFSSEFFTAGEENSVITEGYDADELTYFWYVGGKRIANEGASYAPSSYELESFIKVEIYDGSKKIGSAESYFSKLPVCYISADSADITKNSYIDADMRLQGNKQYSDSKQLYDGKIEIKGRGNTSWNAPKKPYKIKLDSKSNLFNMGKNKHWVLLSNYYDQSSLRNMLSYNMSGEMGLNYQQSVWVNLIMNGKCMGVYQLCEHVRVGKDRTDIFDWEGAAEDAASAVGKANGFSKSEISDLEDQMVQDLSWVTEKTVVFNGSEYSVSDYYKIPEVTGGIVYEADTHYDDISKFTTDHNMLVNINSPEYLNSNSEMFDYAKTYFQAVEDAVYSDDFCTVYNGEKVRYTNLIDLDSFEIGWLVNDLFGNVDYPFKSTYYYKDLNGKLFYGPVWDMDFSGDNAVDGPFYGFRSISDQQRRFMFEMTQDPVFTSRARELYWSIRGTYIRDMLKEDGIFDKDAAYLKEALKKNDEIWNYTYTSDEDTAAYKDWLRIRVNWLDNQFMSNDTLYKALHSDDYSSDMFNDDENEPVSLALTKMPEKTEYLPGEELDFTGAELTVTLKSGETQTVDPDYYIVTMKKTGRFEITYEGVTPLSYGEKTVILCYKNVRAEYPISVYWDTAESVINMINEIPDEVTQSNYSKIAGARKAYDRLNEAEKSAVSSYGRLLAAEESIANIFASLRSNQEYVFNAYYDGIFRYGGTDAVVVETLYSNKTRAIVFLYPNGTTRTVYSSSPNVFTINDGTVETWVIYIPARADYLDVIAKGASTVAYRLECLNYENESTLVKRTDTPSVVTPEFENGCYVYPAQAAFSAVTSPNVDAMSVVCGNAEFPGTAEDSDGSRKWTFNVSLTDTGEFPVKYIYSYLGKDYVFSKEDTCFLREQVNKKDPELVSISIARLPDKLDYRYRDNVDTSGLILRLTYDDGSTHLMNNGYTYSPVKLTKTGSQTVTVNYMDYSAAYRVNVSYSLLQKLVRIFLFGWLWY
ncbi:MAG: CotH kinase family protein [Clostridia bacterium]|nr:CotH kinase family protein [Clostridia bacterium]